MTLDPRIERWRAAATRREIAIALGIGAPAALALVAAVAYRFGGGAAAISTVIASLLLAVAAVRAARRVDAGWLARRLDALEPAMEDSSSLLFGRDMLAPLPALQRARLLRRLDEVGADVRSAWPWRALALAAIVGGLLALAVALAPNARDASTRSDGEHAKASPDATRIEASTLALAPPAYTGIAASTQSALDARVPQDTRLRWQLRFAPSPRAAALQFHDGRRIALQRTGDAWSGEANATASALYRIVVDGAPPLADDGLHRIDVLADRAPEVRVIEPAHSLNLVDTMQPSWPLVFEAADDYGIAKAELVVTLAHGSGENIAFKEQVNVLVGQPISRPSSDAQYSLPSSRRDGDSGVALRYGYAIDLAALGFSTGDDVVARVVVTDNRAPAANVTRGPGVILRWPQAASKDGGGLEGIVQKTMPAYFRSQRQIILDSEALIAERSRLDQAKFLGRSDGIGVDQKLLRLRYGQFLGEESETHAEHAPEGTVGAADTQAGALAAAHDAHEATAPPAPAKFGDAGDVVAEYGHVHDIAEAATLLDPETRATLKSALAEMWQAELHLRQGAPEQALPYEQRALDYIKQVQQATRIYLARVGLELPVPDEARRLGGERKELADRVGTLGAAEDPSTALAVLWHSLDAGARNATIDREAAERALATRGDALDVLAALDRVSRDPACDKCRARLRAALWPLLGTPAAASAPRVELDAQGRAYLEALERAPR
ncbi:hypothetical protein [Dokdonella sp.]|uniref:hypothetical protein n=1 Tax=Dokdonella sp. TaxID=2291710 RepID=UPI00378328BB